MQNLKVKFLQPKDRQLISGMERQAAAPGPAPTDPVHYVDARLPDFIQRKYRVEGIAAGDAAWSSFKKENSVIDNTPLATLRG